MHQSKTVQVLHFTILKSLTTGSIDDLLYVSYFHFAIRHHH